jgi:hypothetical protein
MNPLAPEKLDIVDIRALAASIYEPEPRRWLDGRWRCPQCLKWNRASETGCVCGISRDGLPEFCEK